jgi:hypothetical protein
MRLFMSILFVIVSLITFSQTVEELEYELSFYKSGEKWGNKKEYAYQLLELDGLNRQAINYLIEVFGRNNQRDSISKLFDRLARNNPDNPEMYLTRVRGRNAHFAGLTYTQRINYLRKARELDSTNIEAIYKLGEIYYELFIREFNNNQKRANLLHYSSSAIQFFSELCELDEKYKETLRFPIIQLANYTNDSDKLKIYENYNEQSSYFPVSAFLVLPDEWKTNYTVNVLSFVSGQNSDYYGVESAVFTINWYSKHLIALDEPILTDSNSRQVFRFTWLRTFHNPIVVRIENSDYVVKLHWKVSDGAGGYEPGEIIENQSKKLTIADWSRFYDKVNRSDFWNMNTISKKFIGTDGAQWILEGNVDGKYHVVDRWLGGSIYSICMELLKMTDLNIEELKIY